MLAEKRADITEVETRLTQTEDLHSANEKIKAAEEQAASIAARVVKEYKSDDFERDAAEAGADVYLVGFTDCKDKVA